MAARTFSAVAHRTGNFGVQGGIQHPPVQGPGRGVVFGQVQEPAVGVFQFFAQGGDENVS